MTETVPMRELTRLQSLQIKLGQILLKSRISESLREDLEKLFSAIEQTVNHLHQLHENGLSLDALQEASQRHDVRNLIGVTRGYAELVKDTEVQPSATLSNFLDKIILWSNRSLRTLELGRSEKTQATAGDQYETLPQYSGNILILDDEPANRDLLDRYIQQLGLNSFACANAAEAFEALEQNDIDLILLDLIMPQMSGHEVLAKLKTSQLWRAIPVIVISGLGDQAEVIRCIEAGAEDYLQKPFNRVLLQARLHAGLDRKRWVDTERHLTNELEKSHRFIKNTFGRYLSNEIVNNLLDKPDGLDMGGSLQTVTILMADIRSFTTISEQLSPENVVMLLNNYLGEMADLIMEHGGTVDEFIGDAILALFGAPVTSPQDADNAIRCALAMQNKMQSVNQRNQSLGLPEIQMGIALNTGEVVAGNIGSNKRAKYGVVGHAVNITSRIEDQTHPGEILVSQSTVEQCNLSLDIGRQISLQPKGVSETIRVLQIKDVSKEMDLGASFNDTLNNANENDADKGSAVGESS